MTVVNGKEQTHTANIKVWNDELKGFQALVELDNLTKESADKLMGIVGAKDTGYVVSISPDAGVK